MRLRLVSYNVKGFPWSNPPIQQIVDWAVRSSDVIVLQEVWSRHRLWSSAFSSHGWTFIKPPRETHIVGVFGSGLAVAWRSTDWSMSDARLYPFLSAVGFDSWVTKGWFRVELIHRATGRLLRLINTHMQSDYEVCDELWRPIAEPVRMAQALQLMETEQRMPPAPTLIAGDMNTEMCWMSGSCGWITSHCGPTFPGTSQVLDHCTSWQGQPWTLLEHRVCRECDEWSDHWPVRWDVCWQGA